MGIRQSLVFVMIDMWNQENNNTYYFRKKLSRSQKRRIKRENKLLEERINTPTPDPTDWDKIII